MVIVFPRMQIGISFMHSIKFYWMTNRIRSEHKLTCTKVSQKHRCATCTGVWGRRQSRIDGQEHKPGTARAQPGGTTCRPGWAPDVMLGAEAGRGHGHEESGATQGD